MNTKQQPYYKKKIRVLRMQTAPQTVESLQDAWEWIEVAQASLDEVDNDIQALCTQVEDLREKRDGVHQAYSVALGSPEQDWRTRTPLRRRYYKAISAHSAALERLAAKKLERVYARQVVEDAHSGLMVAVKQRLLDSGQLTEDAMNVVVYYTQPRVNIVVSWDGKQFSISPDGIIYTQAHA